MSKRSEEFDRRFDDFARIYADPVEILFMLASGCIDLGPDFISEEGNAVTVPVDLPTRKSAASELCAYRYPKRKALEITDGEGASGFSFIMLAPGQTLPKPSRAKPRISPPKAPDYVSPAEDFA